MPFVIPDLSLRWVIEQGLKEVRSNPDRFIPNIFGQLNCPELTGLFGKPYLDRIAEWVKKTNIPVVLGFDLEQTALPAVTITLAGMSPSQAFIGDYGYLSSEPTKDYERPVVVPKFTPASVAFNDDRSRIYVTPPATMSDKEQSLIAPGLYARDGRGQEYAVGFDNETLKPYLSQLPGGPSLDDADVSGLEIVSPFSDQLFTNGAMYYDVELDVVVHAPSNRQDGLWLWQIVMWTLLRYRLTMTKLFGIDLAFSSASDFVRATEYDAENVWTRKIRLQTKCMWTWLADPRPDILGLTYDLAFAQASSKPPSDT
jgi:hypothetical protein